MYFSQSINVRLVRENVDVLKRPSKVFNKLKSLLSGEMTPTELQQAYVMLSVLQRLNVALRQSGFEDLVRIRANDTVLYEDDGRTSGDLRAGPAALERGLRESTVGRIDTLELTVDGRGDGLRYLVEVRIARRPKRKRQRTRES